ncbi:hypothetical protein EDC04DRAFT_2819493, partial [Pisolithus marmoratus]
HTALELHVAPAFKALHFLSPSLCISPMSCMLFLPSTPCIPWSYCYAYCLLLAHMCNILSHMLFSYLTPHIPSCTAMYFVYWTPLLPAACPGSRLHFVNMTGSDHSRIQYVVNGSYLSE